jgi:hypothetical protein
VPPEARLPEARELIEQGAYFVVHAPRQTGKTTTLRALARSITASGAYAALWFTCEAGEPFGDDLAATEAIVLEMLRTRASLDLPAEVRPPAPWPDAAPGSRLLAGLGAWSLACPRPVVLLFDEIDALRGESLRSVLRQLRAGFVDRPTAFPAAVVLAGLRDVRDYKAAAGGDPSRLGTSSPFNVKVESLRLGDFSEADVRSLLGQHTTETGQPFTAEATRRVIDLTGGQPWLVNALAREVVEKLGLAADLPITEAHVEDARERLILARATHLDSLVARLMEPRVRRIVEPIMAGALAGGDTFDDDVAYVRDLGLIARDRPVRIANPIYREVIVRVLSGAAEEQIDVRPPAYVEADGRLSMARILEDFAVFWRTNGDVLAGKMPYHEVAPQLVLMAFLQRVVNGGGQVEREYGVGRGRIDLLVRWPLPGGDTQRAALELKVWAEGRPDPLAEGLLQLDAYLERLSLGEGTLVVFDRRSAARDVSGRTRFEDAVTVSGRVVRVLRA